MALIYLDTSHISLLCTTRLSEPEQFRSFIEAWRTHGHVLALSHFHLVEFRQHDDAQIRAARYQVLAELLPLRITINPANSAAVDLTDKEIVRTLLLQGIVQVRGTEAKQWIRANAAVFPYTIETRAELAEWQKVMETWVSGFFVKTMRGAIKLGAKAQHRPANEKYKSARLKDLPEQIEDRKAQVLIIVSEYVVALLAKILPLPAYGREKIRELRDLLRNARKIGPRAAFAQHYGVTNPERTRQRVDRISQDLLLKESASRVTRETLGVSDAGELSIVVNAVRLEDCPGTWIRHMMDLEIRRAEPDPDPGNAYDLEHISYLPHVDLLTADQRIVRYAEQVFRRGNVPPSLTGCSLPERIPSSMAALQALICRD